MKIKILLILNIFVLIGSYMVCEKPYTAEDLKIINELKRHRETKDSLFQYAEWTPLSKEDRENFHGLVYFPIDLSQRFKGPIIEYESTILDTIRETKGDLRPAIKYGFFPFQYKNRELKIQIYKILSDAPQSTEYLFMGFTDETTGKETYGAGRYINPIKKGENIYIVDFNLAYNPYCAYNKKYSCAIPPDENHFNFSIFAGEKIYRYHK